MLALSGVLFFVLAGSVASAQETVSVHIDSPKRGARLFRVTSLNSSAVVTWSSGGGFASGVANGASYRSECTAPCGRLIEHPTDMFFISGPDIPDSSAFSLDGMGENVTVKVKPGSDGLRAGGWTLLLLGAAAAGVGIPLAAMARDNQGMLGAGIGCLVGGGLAMILGIPMIAASGTDVRLVKRRYSEPRDPPRDAAPSVQPETPPTPIQEPPPSLAPPRRYEI